MEQAPVLPSRDTVRHISTFRDPTQTYLESPWTLWLVNKMGTPNKTWLDCIHPIATFSTIQQFWGMYNTLKPPSELPVYWEYAVFRGGLGRRVIIPDWDDHENIGGGCMQLTGFNLDPKIIDHLWRDICLKIIEEAWIHTSDYINGVMISAKSGTTRFYVWVAPCKEHVWECVRDRIEGVFAQVSTVRGFYKESENDLLIGSSVLLLYVTKEIVERIPQKKNQKAFGLIASVVVFHTLIYIYILFYGVLNAMKVEKANKIPASRATISNFRLMSPSAY